MVTQRCSGLANKEDQKDESEQNCEVHLSCAQNHGDQTVTLGLITRQLGEEGWAEPRAGSRVGASLASLGGHGDTWI